MSAKLQTALSRSLSVWKSRVAGKLFFLIPKTVRCFWRILYNIYGSLPCLTMADTTRSPHPPTKGS